MKIILSNYCQYFLICFFYLMQNFVSAQVFDSKTVLYSNSQGFSGWFTENQYNTIDSHNGDVYFVMLDDARRPFVGKIKNGVTTIQALEKTFPSYKPVDDGHQEYSIGIDKDGYIHVTGDMHNYPQAFSSHIPASYSASEILYWKSSSPGDISDFNFIGTNMAETIPGSAFSYGRFVTDRNGVLYYLSRTLARDKYWQNGGRGLGLYVYNEISQSWTARGVNAPISDATFPVIAWEESGQNGGSYQQFKANIQFDKNNRMHLVTGMNTQNGPNQVNSIVYAYSDDGGLTFHKANDALIALPMEVKAGAHQGDVLDSEPLSKFEQPFVSYAYENKPIVHYTANGSSYYKYWTGTAWSSKITSPVGTRGVVLFNEHTDQLLFINIQGGAIYAKTSFTSSTEFYDAGETFRYFDLKTFRSENTLTGISWKTSTGNFQVIQLKGPTTVVMDCANVPNGTASVDLCGVCSGGITGVIPNSTCSDCNGDVFGAASIDSCGICSGGLTSVSPCIGSIQGEEACQYLGLLETKNTGYVGAGYINMDNQLDADIIWSLNSVDNVSAEFSIRYANSSSNDRGASIVLNGTVLPLNLTFASTGSWTNWMTENISLPLVSGTNVLQLKASTSEGLPNIDQLSFDQDVTLGSCIVDCNGQMGGAAILDSCGMCTGGNTGMTPILDYGACITGVNELMNNALQLFPNPVRDYIQLSQKMRWELYSTFGVRLGTGEGSYIDMKEYNRGIYFVKVAGEIRKVMKE